MNLRASSMVSGSFCPSVSGKKTANAPAMVATTPMMNTGAGSQNILSRSSRREVMPPILATKEQMPTVWFLIWVGNISAVQTYTMATEAEAPNFPIKDKYFFLR